MTTPRGQIRVNDRALPLVDVPVEERLLDTVRWRLDLKGTKEGCRTGDCGACTVLVNGRTVLSCLALTHELDGTHVTTVEAVGSSDTGRRIQEAFAREGALQCGYCTPGFVVALAGLVDEHGSAADPRLLLEELGTNLCRCTGYRSIVRAVERLGKESR